jgi:hypothetical protein
MNDKLAAVVTELVKADKVHPDCLGVELKGKLVPIQSCEFACFVIWRYGHAKHDIIASFGMQAAQGKRLTEKQLAVLQKDKGKNKPPMLDLYKSFLESRGFDVDALKQQSYRAKPKRQMAVLFQADVVDETNSAVKLWVHQGQNGAEAMWFHKTILTEEAHGFYSVPAPAAQDRGIRPSVGKDPSAFELQLDDAHGAAGD